MPRYEIVYGVHYNGRKKYRPGDKIDMPEARAKQHGNRLKYIGPTPGANPDYNTSKKQSQGVEQKNFDSEEKNFNEEKKDFQELMPKHRGAGKYDIIDKETGVKIHEEPFDSRFEAQRYIDGLQSNTMAST